VCFSLQAQASLRPFRPAGGAVEIPPAFSLSAFRLRPPFSTGKTIKSDDRRRSDAGLSQELEELRSYICPHSCHKW
jgi:hypothetical protein